MCWLPALALMLSGTGCDTGAALLGPLGAGAQTPTMDSSELVFAQVSGPFARVYEMSSETLSETVRGAITAPGEAVGYEIGPILAGDRLIIDVRSLTDGFDAAAAVFDDNDDLLVVNDDRSYYGGQRNPYIDVVVRRDSQRCTVAVSSSPRSDSTGEFSLKVTRQAEGSFSPTQPQIVYINFNGQKQVTIGRREPVDVPPFSGAMIGPAYAGDTVELMERVLEHVRADYRGFNVTISGSNEADPPAEAHTTIYMGSYNPALLGIADSVDLFNERPIQQAIVFVDTFAAFAPLEPTVDELATALANVTSHELGHLLGLNHTHDPTGIMDISASLRQMLADQSFKRSPLNDDTFPAGFQDAIDRLLAGIGGNESVVRAVDVLRRTSYRDPWYDEGPKTPARLEHLFGTACSGE